jgi:hypothetical protein
MCISNNRYEAPRVDFKDTILYAGVVRKDNGDVRHVLGYYNKVATLAGASAAGQDFGWDVSANGGDDFGYEIAPAPRKVGNAMLFCVPAKPGTLTANSLIPVKDYPAFMEDYKRAVAPPQAKRRGASDSMSFSLGADSAPVVVKGFDGGTYDVVIAPGGPSQIAQVIAQADEDKRPALNEELYAELTTAYPGFTAVLFCFSESDAEKAGCALIEYEPLLPHLLFLPGLDGHNGAIERGQVEVNHTLVLGHYDMKTGNAVRFTDQKLRGLPGYGGDDHLRRSGAMSLTAPIPKRPYWALPRVVGKTTGETTMPQGDFWALVEDVKKGNFRVRRQVPPGWNKLPGSPADPAGATKYYITNA